MVKSNVKFLKGSTFFEIIHSSMKELFLEKNPELRVQLMKRVGHTLNKYGLTYLYEQPVWKCKRNEKLKTDCES